MKNNDRPLVSLMIMLLWVMLLAFFFAHTEIEIEGPAGWAAHLPTWRIEKHWLLDIFWGGRPMTGYHAWLFPFIALFFHFPLIFEHHWSSQREARVIACIMLFWLTEDFLWFVFNPAYGVGRFDPAHIAWHKHWLWVAPIDYWVAIGGSFFLLRYSYREMSDQALREDRFASSRNASINPSDASST
jgi:hypothetical protein